MQQRSGTWKNMICGSVKNWNVLPLSLSVCSCGTASSTNATVTMESQRPKRSSKNRGKSSYGTSRRSVLKKSFSQEQVTFTAPPSDDPLVAIIGGGISGLICSLFLENRGVRSTVFDTVSLTLSLHFTSPFHYAKPKPPSFRVFTVSEEDWEPDSSILSR